MRPCVAGDELVFNILIGLEFHLACALLKFMSYSKTSPALSILSSFASTKRFSISLILFSFPFVLYGEGPVW